MAKQSNKVNVVIGGKITESISAFKYMRCKIWHERGL